MKKYLTRANAINLLIFIQFALIQYRELYNLSGQVQKHISLALLLIGYWVNTDIKGVSK